MRLILRSYIDSGRMVPETPAIRRAVAIIEIWEPNAKGENRHTGNMAFYGETPEKAEEAAKAHVEAERQKDLTKAANYAAGGEKNRARRTNGSDN